MRRFPGWRWAAVALAFPIAGLIGRAISGPVDSVGPALLGGAITGAGLGAAQVWAAGRVFGDAGSWIAVTAFGYALGLAAGAALVDYETSLGSLVVMGLVSGASLGAVQAGTLLRHDDARFALAWGLSMAPLFAVCWVATWAIGVSVDEQFTVFGAAGAVVFAVISGALLAQLPYRTSPLE
jgi:hypothetical protein